MPAEKYTAEFKSRIVLSILQGDRKVTEVCSAYHLNPGLVNEWKQEFLKNAHLVFDADSNRKISRRKERELEEKRMQMEHTVEQLKLERAFLQHCFHQVGAPIPKMPGYGSDKK